MSFQQRRPPTNVYLERVFDDPMGKYRLCYESGARTNVGLFISEDTAKEWLRQSRPYWRLIAMPNRSVA